QCRRRPGAAPAAGAARERGARRQRQSSAHRRCVHSRTRCLSHPDYVDLRERTQSFSGVLAYNVLITSFANRPDEPAQTKLGFAVSGNFFDVLELRPALGRLFLPDEDRVPGRDAVVVLSYPTWT